MESRVKNIQIFTVIAFAFFINGCASQYTPPNSGSQAKVTYISEANNNALQVFHFKSYECKKPEMIKSFKQSGTRQRHTIYVQAGKKFINTFRLLQTSTSHLTWHYSTIEVTPQENEEYLITLHGETYVKSSIKKLKNNEYELIANLTRPERSCTWWVLTCKKSNKFLKNSVKLTEPSLWSVRKKHGQASVLKTQKTTVTVNIEDGESIEIALRKLKKKVKYETDRRWHKRRFGYYEKPYLLKRKAKKMKAF